MPHQLRLRVECPGLGQVGLQTDELRVGILEQGLVLLVPPVALYHDVVECGQIARLLDGGLPSDGVLLVLCRGVGIGVAHLGDEVVLHRGEDVQIVEQRVEGLGVRVHELVLQREWRQFVARRCRRLPAVGPLAAYDVHLVVFGPVDDVGRHLGDGPRRGIELLGALEAAVLGAPCTLPDEGGQNAWKLHRGIGTILVGAHVGGAAAGLPFVGAVQVDVQFLAATEGVAAGDTHLQLRSHASDGAVDEVGLHVEVVGLVEGAVQRQVERVAVSRGEG